MPSSPPERPSLLLWFRALPPRVRARIVVALVGVVAAVVGVAACGGCGKKLPPGGDPTVVSAADDARAPRAELVLADAAVLRDTRMWTNAKDGDVEDLASLAVHEGAVGLVEAAGDPTYRATALRAMGYARGWAQLPTLARAAAGKNDDEAATALDATLELATRARTAEDPEDAAELREGCEAMIVLARDRGAARSRRVSTIRALRMMPCVALDGGSDLPHDVDTK